MVKKKFNLSEKREELKRQISLVLRPLKPDLRILILNNIFDLIKSQDKEFIKLLKELIASVEERDLYGFRPKTYLGWKIDELTGFKK